MKQLICLSLIFLFASCTRFLEPDLNKSQTTIDQVYNNDVTATAAITGIYNSISSNSPFSAIPSGMNALAGLSAGELSYSQQDSELKIFELHEINPQNSSIEALWNFMYGIIYQANAVLEGVEGSTSLSTGTATQLRGEALFMRAFTYFYLVNFFGGVPLVLGTDYRINQSVTRQSVDDVYAQIKIDLLLAQSLLSNEYVTEQKVRPNKAAVTALLARVHLYRQEYVDAELQASSLIDNTVYRLLSKDSIDQIFLIDSKETIWQIMPVLSNVNTVEGYYFIITTTPRYNTLTDELRLHFEEDDLRASHWINSFTNSLGKFYYPFKYKQNTKDVNASYTECSVVFRLAEMFLIRAEARSYRGNISGAQSDLNAVRLRAGLIETEANDQQSLALAIESERWSELFTEYGHRWLDLKRTGRAIYVLGNGITTSDLLYPLPAVEFIKNPRLGEQNPNY